MNLGVSGFINMSFGFYQLLINIILIGIALLYVRNYLGIGSIVSMIGIGFIADYFVNIYIYIFGGSLSFTIKFLILALAVIIIGIGFSLYMTSELGVAPYDAIALMILKACNNKIPFAAARVITDVACVLVGFSFGATVGISTVITAFFTGPIVQYFNTHVSEVLLQKVNEPKLVKGGKYGDF
jgi:uncharacterized membrane protein YczE